MQGFKCGLEIHQQLAGKKMFCDCPAINSQKKPDMKVSRRLRAVVGETGEVDVAAAHEMAKAMVYNYVGNSEDVCLVEFDEEPPHAMNREALATVLEFCHHVNAKVVDEIQVMRKTVVDGSNVSGFQRTALVGYDGYIETSEGKVKIPSICIEEEAAQKLKADKTSVTYKLDRLGITLIEIATDPDIKSPEHAKETAEKLGMILRSLGGVKRGLGTIRQDVNISIKGGARTEIKGFQDLKSIPKVIEKEVERQEKLIKQNKKIEMQVRKAEPDFSTTFLRPMPGAARMYPETDVLPIRPGDIKFEQKELIADKIMRYSKLMGADLAKKLGKSEKAELFDSMKLKNVKPAFVAETLISYERELRRDYKDSDPELVRDSDIKKVFAQLDIGKISKDAVMKLIVDIASGKKLDFSKYAVAKIDEGAVKKIVEENKGAPMGAVMGKVMAKFKGADGRKVSELVKKYI